MGESIHDALKIMGIVETSGKDADLPPPSWDFYAMFQAFIQVIGQFVVVINFISLYLVMLVDTIVLE